VREKLAPYVETG